MSTEKNLELQRKTNKKKSEYKYFVGSSIKNPLTYSVGEKIVFKIRAKHMDRYLDVPYAHYTLLLEGGTDESGYIKCRDDGWFYIETSLSQPGFAYIKVRACDENKQFIIDIEEYNGSAGADLHKLNRATEIPSDYIEFWNSLYEAVECTEPEVLFSNRITDPLYPDFTIYDMRIKAPNDDYVSLILTYPNDAKKNELKFAMLFQGYGVNPAKPYPLKDYLTVHVGAHAIPNGMSPEYYTELYNGELYDYGFNTEDNKRPETTYWAKMLLRDLQALKFFKNHELINKKDYYFIGSSQGGMQACNIAAHFEGASAVILNVPWLSDTQGHELGGRLENTMPKGAGISYFDTAVAAEFLKCPTYIISGLGDKTCNSSTQMALFNSIKSPKYIEFYQNKTHSLTIPLDNCMYSLGDKKLSKLYNELTSAYYDWN